MQRYALPAKQRTKDKGKVEGRWANPGTPLRTDSPVESAMICFVIHHGKIVFLRN